MKIARTPTNTTSARKKSSPPARASLLSASPQNWGTEGRRDFRSACNRGFSCRFCLRLCWILALALAGSQASPTLSQPNSRQNGVSRAKGLIGLFDPEYHNGTKLAKGQADKYDRLPILPAGSVVNRNFIVYNDATAGTKVQVRVQPILHTGPKESRKLPSLVRALTVPNNGRVSLRLPLSVPKVAMNMGLELVLTVSKQNRERFRDSIIFVAVPEGKGGTTVTYEGRDDKTHGDWGGGYGKQAFLVPVRLGRSAFQLPGITLQRGSGFEKHGPDNPFENDQERQQQMINFEDSETTEDPRVALRVPGLKERSPAAFLAVDVPLLIRVDTTDGRPHRLSLYLLDYKREGRVTEVSLYDLQGHRLDTHRVADYGEGAYLRYRFTGSLIVRLVLKKRGDPTLSGVFVDAVD